MLCYVMLCYVMSCYVMFLVPVVLLFRRKGNANDIISKQQNVTVFIPKASMFGISILSRTERVRDTRRLSSYNLRLENNKIQILDKVLK